jgi:type III pantothenate kinase
VADFGAALTFIALNGAGELLGAAIAPGLDTSALALRGSAAQLPQVRLELPERAIGKNSAAAVRSGIVLGYRGLSSAIVAGMRAELAEEAALIGTGDELGRAVLEGLGCRAFVPDLTLEGLALIAQRNGYAPGA